MGSTFKTKVRYDTREGSKLIWSIVCYWSNELCNIFIFSLTCYSVLIDVTSFVPISHVTSNGFFSSVPLIPLYRCRGFLSFFLIISQTVGLLRRGIGPSQGRYLHTGQHKHRKTHTHTKHPCPEWYSNPRSRLPSERRLCMP
jgi:hypothetical protein